MVYELSARLLKGHNITYNTATASGGKRMSDVSSTSSSSASSNGEIVSRKPKRVLSRSSDDSSTERFSNRDACFKRRKIDELRFAASKVKDDLEKGGLPFPSIHSKKPRALEGYDINMSNIRLLSAKAVSDSPFLIKATTAKRSYQNVCAIDQLFSETRQVYSKNYSQGDVSSDWDKSSTGSLTSDSEASCAVDIPPLLEDSLKYKSAEMKASPSVLASVKTVSMETALHNSTEARLVTLSFAPFLIIHVNAAYTRMTGIGAKDVLGKPFRDVFKDKRCKAMAGSVSSLATLHEQLTSVSTIRQDKRCNCSLQVSFVGEKSNATHCMVALRPTDHQEAAQPLVTSVPKKSLHFSVVA